MLLPFRPNCFPSALGPLPHRSAREAWDICVRYLPEVLPLPLLGNDGEDPAALAADGFAGATVALDHLSLDRDAAVEALDGLYLAYLRNRIGTRALLLAALDEWGPREGQIRRAQAISTVLMGPVSLALRLVDDDGIPALADSTIVDALAKHLHLRLGWQQSKLGGSTRVLIQWLYEPYLHVVGSPFSPVDWRDTGHILEEVFGTNNDVHAVWMGEGTDLPALLAELPVDVVGIPIPQPAVVESWAPALHDFIRRRGVIAWGIVPQTVEGLAHARVGRLAARFGDVLHVLEGAGLPVAEVVQASLIMPEDTLAHLYPSEAEAVLAMTSQLSGLLRHAYGLD